MRSRWPRRFLGVLFLTALALTAGVPGAFAEEVDQQNNHTAAFLRLGVDARHLALGGTGAALAEGPAAGYWNPAGLAGLRGWSLTGMITQKLNFDRRHNYIAGAWGGERFAVAASWINAGTDDIPEANASGLTGETFNFSENAILLSAGAQAGAASVGIGVKLVTQGLGSGNAPGNADDQAYGYGVDLGAQFSVTQYAQVGLVIQDAFGEVGKTDRNNVNDIPANLRVGLALEPVDGFVLASDLEKTRDDDNVRFHAGVEFGVPLGTNLDGAVRLGVREGKMSGGFGAKLGALGVDYAYVIEPEAFLDENHRFSVTLNFGAQRQLIREDDSADRDLDGFPDNDDDCPDDPEDFDGFDDYDGCPEIDNDQDGIADFDDLCPDEPEDMDGFEDDDGCPDLDNDGDGIPDARDRCPDEAETRNGFEDDDGCPDEGSFTFPSVQIRFASGSAILPAAAAASALAPMVAVLQENPSLRVEIQGHTDSQGDPVQNQQLSERRARAVKDYLVSRGIEAARLEVRGYGAENPVASNATAAGRAQNRRIEFVQIP